MSELNKYIVEKVIPIPEGKYNARISEVVHPTEEDEYKYIRYKLALDYEGTPTLNLSFPTRITYLNDGSPSSSHAKFLLLMGLKVEFEKDVSGFISSLQGKKVSCLVQQKTTDKGTFSEVVKESVKTL